MSAKSLRLLYTSNAFWAASGYGVQGRSLLPRLAELPEFGGRENIAQFAWYGLQGGMHQVDGFRVYPSLNDPYGNDVIGAHTRDFGANLVVSLIDIWVLHDTPQKIAPALFCPWLPIDHTPVPQRVIDSLAGAHLPLTYAKWGHQMLTEAGVENVYIPHGIEPGVYHVVREREHVATFKRQLTGLEHCHLSVMVAANKGFPDRKWFQGQLRAWATFAKDKPDARLYLHTEPTPMYGGLDLAGFVNVLGLKWREMGGRGDADAQVIFPDRYRNAMGYPPEYLSMVYNAADVLLAASMSEGFGIPLIEAQACGCPVVTTNFSAMPELVRWGYAVEVQDLMLTPMQAWQAWPSVTDMINKLQRLYEAWVMVGEDWPIAKRLEVSKLITDEYNWDTIVRDQWAPLITRLANEAPALHRGATGVDVPPAEETPQSFVDALNEEVAKATPVVPRRRVAPLVAREAVAA